ncbi:MAG: putative nucleotidyltransferase substrate binding domain-containing protein [Dermatophilaceae bacterium]
MTPDVELTEIRDFLAQHPPFDTLPVEVLDALPGQLRIEYFRRGTYLVAIGRDNHHLYVLRSGAVDVHDDQGALVDRGEEGTCFGSITLVSGNPSTMDALAIEDSLALVMRAETFRELGEEHPEFARFFDLQRKHRMGQAVATQQLSVTGGPYLKARVRDLLTRPPVSTATTTTIAEAAKSMAVRGISSLLVMDGSRLAGIVTDRDLRNRVLAAGRDPGDPVSTIMTPDPVTSTVETPSFEAMLEMVRRSIHHLPILQDGVPVGIITTTDIMRLERANPINLVGDIREQPDVERVAEVSARIGSVVEALVAQDASADDIGRVVTSIGDATVRRLLALAESHLGPPPVPYCWVTLGSRARYEQALAADQDNAMIVADERQPEHKQYFLDLATFVTQGLVRCGYPPCPGGVMATHPKLRARLTTWHKAFTDWFTEPTPDNVLQASIFFDMRPVHGESSLYAALQRHVLAMAPSSKRFLAHLAKRAVEREPPLGFFRGFVLERHGEHKDALDIKKGGIGAVVELARVHALSVGSGAVNTRARINATVAAGVMNLDRGEDLRDAFEFISYVRLRHQAEQVRDGRPIDNFVAPDTLSSFDKRHLREAFGIVRAAQASLTHFYPLTYMS